MPSNLFVVFAEIAGEILTVGGFDRRLLTKRLGGALLKRAAALIRQGCQSLEVLLVPRGEFADALSEVRAVLVDYPELMDEALVTSLRDSAEAKLKKTLKLERHAEIESVAKPVSGYALSADGKKLLLRSANALHVIKPGPKAKLDGDSKIDLEGWSIVLGLSAEF